MKVAHLERNTESSLSKVQPRVVLREDAEEHQYHSTPKGNPMVEAQKQISSQQTVGLPPQE